MGMILESDHNDIAPESAAPAPAPVSNQPPGANGGLPAGNHPLEIAARRGIGPLSGQGAEIWHGHARPCVSCGQLARRGGDECDLCGQDLSVEMIEKMRTHAGPWYVLEHVRPFPGVSLERILLQVRRGLITETSIVRGPATDYQWRFAVETPGLCRYFGRCWHCYEPVAPSDAYCKACLAHLSFDKPRPAAEPSGSAVMTQRTAPGETASARRPASTASLSPRSESSVSVSGPAPGALHPASPNQLSRLSAAVVTATTTAPGDVWDEPPRIGGLRATWVVAAMMTIVIVGLLWVTRARNPNDVPAGVTTPINTLLESPGSD